MVDKVIKFYSKANSNIVLNAIPGHFATSSSHVNYYTDVTSLKTISSKAEVVAKTFAQHVSNISVVDTIVCLEGCEMIGAYLAQQLQRGNIHTNNPDRSVYVVTPEINMNGQIMFRDNLVHMIKDRNVIIVTSTATTGRTMRRALNVIDYYSGHTMAIFALFSAVRNVDAVPVDSIFDLRDVPGYQTFDPQNCPMCKAGQRVEAMVNAYGLSKF